MRPNGRRKREGEFLETDYQYTDIIFKCKKIDHLSDYAVLCTYFFIF